MVICVKSAEPRTVAVEEGLFIVQLCVRKMRNCGYIRKNIWTLYLRQKR